MTLKFGEIYDRVDFALGKRADLPKAQVENSIVIAMDKIIRMHPWPEIIRLVGPTNHDLSTRYEFGGAVLIGTRFDPSEIAYITHIEYKESDANTWQKMLAAQHQQFQVVDDELPSGIRYWYNAADQRIYFNENGKEFSEERVVEIRIYYARIATYGNDEDYPILDGKDDAIIAYAASDLYRLLNELESSLSWKAEGDRIVALEVRSDFDDNSWRKNPIGFVSRIYRGTIDPVRDPFVYKV